MITTRDNSSENKQKKRELDQDRPHSLKGKEQKKRKWWFSWWKDMVIIIIIIRVAWSYHTPCQDQINKIRQTGRNTAVSRDLRSVRKPVDLIYNLWSSLGVRLVRHFKQGLISYLIVHIDIIIGKIRQAVMKMLCKTWQLRHMIASNLCNMLTSDSVRLRDDCYSPSATSTRIQKPVIG